MPSDVPDIPVPAQPAYPYKADGVRLRPILPADVRAVNAYRSLPEVARYLPHPPQAMADTELSVSAMVSQQNFTTPGQWLDPAVEHGPSAEVVGEVLLKWDVENWQRGEIGFVFSPDVQGQGVAFAACTAALDMAFEHFSWHRVEGICDARNNKSAALMTRLGMRLEATFVEADWSKGEWITLRHYAILKREWSLLRGHDLPNTTCEKVKDIDVRAARRVRRRPAPCAASPHALGRHGCLRAHQQCGSAANP